MCIVVYVYPLAGSIVKVLEILFGCVMPGGLVWSFDEATRGAVEASVFRLPPAGSSIKKISTFHKSRPSIKINRVMNEPYLL
jgi:hypothetical protein